MLRLVVAGLLLLGGGCRPAPTPAPEPAPSPRSSPASVADGAPEGSDLVLRKRAEGITFYALGTEPFWALDGHPEEGWTLREPEGVVAALPPAAPTPAGEPSGEPGDEPAGESTGAFVVRTAEDGLVLEAMLVPEDCRDAMSGAPFTHRVEIELRGPAGARRRFAGCGRFTEPARPSGG
jgi:uncharacterized membrane protein